ncbi:hypothetical protein [Actinoplanes sp. NPDC089786]|uniref:hypothetical protein n=1 Tax=Actinoplanes sp. NPDC089786 TaxID=3155185 RepID=UPI003423B986
MLASVAPTAACIDLKPVAHSVDNTVAVLEDSLTRLGQESEDWRSVLTDTAAKLTEDTQTTVRTEVTQLLQRGAQAAGVQARCGIDFLAARMGDGLRRILDRVLGRDQTPRQPKLCDASPALIELALPADRRTSVQYSGWDLDTDPVIEAQLTGPAGSTPVPASALARVSAYLLVLNTGQNGIGPMLGSGAAKVELRWQGMTLSEVPIVQPPPPECPPPKLERLLTQTTELAPSNELSPNSDEDFFGNGPTMDLHITVRTVESRRVEADVRVTARETHPDGRPEGDGTAFDGEVKKVLLYEAPPNHEILDPLTAEMKVPYYYAEPDYRPYTKPVGGAAPVRTITYHGDTFGPGLNRTKVVLEWNTDVKVRIQQTSRCHRTTRS